VGRKLKMATGLTVAVVDARTRLPGRMNVPNRTEDRTEGAAVIKATVYSDA
jgi:hypothetical protein